MSAEFRAGIVNHIPALRAYARVLQRDREAADDLVQKCLARAIAKQHLWQPGTNLKAWLFTILHNLFVNSVRRRGRTETYGDPATELHLFQPEQQTGTMRLRELEAAFHQLPEEYRETLALIVMQGMRYGEAAEVQNVPIGTIRSRVFRGRQELKRRLGLASETHIKSAENLTLE